MKIQQTCSGYEMCKSVFMALVAQEKCKHKNTQVIESNFQGVCVAVLNILKTSNWYLSFLQGHE